MKVIIISDIHDNIVNLKKTLDYARAQESQVLLCCGDVARDDTIEFTAKNFAGEIHLVRGNMCMFDDKAIMGYNNITYYGQIARIKIDNFWVGLCHEPYKIDKVLELGDCDYIFYGHTHKPWEEKRGNTRVINPGTLNGIYKTSTFAIWDTETNELSLKMIQ